MKELTQYTLPTFYDCKIDENYMKHILGTLKKYNSKKYLCQERKSHPTFIQVEKNQGCRPCFPLIIDTGFLNENFHNLLYDMTVTDDQKVWIGGRSNELNLFDLQGHLHLTVTMPCRDMYICMYKKQVVFSDLLNKAWKKISDYVTPVTMFTTGILTPEDITGSTSGDLLVCLRQDDQSKVVRYSSARTVLQIIQYDSQCHPL